MKNFIAPALFCLASCLSTNSFAQDWSGTTYKYYEIYPGYIVTTSGDTTRGYVELNGRSSNQKTCVFYSDASKKDKKKYKPADLIAYAVGDKQYRTITFNSFLGKSTSFALVVKPARVSMIIFYTKKENVIDMIGRNETPAEFDARLHTDEIIWQKQDENPVQQGELILGFAKKISKMLSDCPELSAKVENKEKGYGMLNTISIMEEYNAWWAAKKK